MAPVTANSDGTVDMTRRKGVDADLRVRPFFAHGGTFAIRDFIVGALQNEMGMQAWDPDLAAAVAGRRVVTSAGMILDGAIDKLDAPPTGDVTDDPDGDGVVNEAPQSVVDFMEFYLLNYFKPARGEQTEGVVNGRQVFARVGCARCHVSNLTIERDRRVADVETTHDPVKGIFQYFVFDCHGAF